MNVRFQPTAMHMMKQHGRRLVRALRVDGRCFDCLMHEELYPAEHPKHGRRIYLCQFCKLDLELKDAFQRSVFSERSTLRM